MAEAHHYLTIAELQKRIRTREVTPVEIVDCCLARIAALNDRLNAVALVLGDQAREQARQADREIRDGRWRGPLHGIPVGIKDFYDTAGVATTAAFEGFRNRVPRVDAVGVRRLKSVGAVIVGKMNMHTLGMGTTGLESCFGPVRNPWHEAFIPGGSSSGSAAAVAAGLCYATLDTDAIGSCRLPAACCGVIGFKGTYGLLSTKGILEGEKADDTIVWYSHPAITTRSVEDTSILLRALAEPQHHDDIDRFERQSRDARRSRIGIAENAKAGPGAEPVVAAALEVLRTLTLEVVDATAPLEIPRFGDLHAIEADRQSVADRAFREIDILVLPTLTDAVPTVNQARGNPQALSPAFTMFANYFGLPAISGPCGFDDRGLPVGLQFVGRPWEDQVVLRVAHEFAAAGGFASQHPIP